MHHAFFIRQFCVPRRPTERHVLTFSTAERPVCVPYKRNPVRLNRRVAAPAASATLNVQKITKRAFDGRTMHRLSFTLCIYSSILCSPVARPNGTLSRFPPRNARCAFPTRGKVMHKTRPPETAKSRQRQRFIKKKLTLPLDTEKSW